METGNITPETLIKLLRQDVRHSIVIWADEIHGFLKQFDDKSRGTAGDSDFLSAYNGKPIKVNRIGDSKLNEKTKSILVRNPSATVYGAIQPERFKSLIGAGDKDTSGFWARFLFWYDFNNEPFKVGFMPKIEEIKKVNEWLKYIFDNIYASEDARQEQYDFGIIQGHINEEFKTPLRMTSEAYNLWVNWFDVENYNERKPGGLYHSNNGWHGKMSGHAIRIAAIFHLINCGIRSRTEGRFVNCYEEKITYEEMKAALRLMPFASAITEFVLTLDNPKQKQKQKTESRYNYLLNNLLEHFKINPTKYVRKKENAFHFYDLEILAEETQEVKEQLFKCLIGTKHLLPCNNNPDSDYVVYYLLPQD